MKTNIIFDVCLFYIHTFFYYTPSKQEKSLGQKDFDFSNSLL